MDAESTNDTRNVRTRILDAASELFYAEGVHAVGIDRILRAANAAKASLYDHFSSKDELVAAYLEHRGAQWRSHVSGELEKRGGSAKDRLLRLFELLSAWTCTSEFRGCPFLNAAGELSEPGHPALEVARRQRQWHRDLIRELVEATDVDDVGRLTMTVVVLYDGVVASAFVDGQREAAAAAARWTLDRLLAEA